MGVPRPSRPALIAVLFWQSGYLLGRAGRPLHARAGALDAVSRRPCRRFPERRGDRRALAYPDALAAAARLPDRGPGPPPPSRQHLRHVAATRDRRRTIPLWRSAPWRRNFAPARGVHREPADAAYRVERPSAPRR